MMQITSCTNVDASKRSRGARCRSPTFGKATKRTATDRHSRKEDPPDDEMMTLTVTTRGDD